MKCVAIEQYVVYTDIVKVHTDWRDWTELNWLGLVFNELTNRQAGQAYWSLVDLYVLIVI